MTSRRKTTPDLTGAVLLSRSLADACSSRTAMVYPREVFRNPAPVVQHLLNMAEGREC